MCQGNGTLSFLSKDDTTMKNFDSKNSNDPKIAVLIDADNVPHSNSKGMLDEITKYGIPTIKRIYGDWTKTTMRGWKSILLENAITPVQQYSYTIGKNATDSTMIIDAMDILHRDEVDGFCIVSSDSDFTRLATRLRESGKFVIGIGEKKTPQPFIVSCDKFIYLEILDKGEEGHFPEKSETSRSLRVSANKKNVPDDIIELLRGTINDMADEDGWAFLGDVGNSIIKKRPDFDSRNYGFEKLTLLVNACEAFFEIDSRKVENRSNKLVYVKNK